MLHPIDDGIILMQWQRAVSGRGVTSKAPTIGGYAALGESGSSRRS
ncbi:conserved hypothetical protein [Coraliomargarita akajimensis DSM 45221]|uniref:Uncharacterized protein n=1 Tax=Coraliomargarita akajimensis (strain DSM 45221 / IAM 15411 / JCM 23193 / KCTC 12865 / 04OKA010-24) TaxID=583355 RepID=D5EI83_CORAD|nr:conserved hypothetical protein [Coraliomargarita akajimensis DSM 45221]